MRTLKICSMAFLCLLVFGFITPSFVSAIDNSPYGLNDWNFTDEAMKAAQEAGVTWMRIQVIWRQIEPVQGAFSWNSGATSRVDYYMSQVEKYGMKVTLTVYISPDWAKQPGLTLPRPEPFAAFVKEVLNRYPGKIAAVEILSEENTGSWPNTKNRDAIFYVPILKAAYRAVKEVSPNTLVLTSSLWSSPIGYLEDMYAQGAKGYFDVLNFHYYPSKYSPALNYTWLISHYRKVMQKYGDGAKPIWMTEFAWPIDDEPEGFRTADIVSPQQQSDYLTYTLNTSMKSGFVKKAFWYVLTGDDGMAMIHDTDYFYWMTPARLTSAISDKDSSLMILGGKPNKWPQSGIVTIDAERIGYSSVNIPQTGSPSLGGLSRGIDGTTAAAHAVRSLVYNQDVNPELTTGISGGDTALTITGNWTKRWPSDGVLIIDAENIKYASSSSSGSTTIFIGLTRGYENTAPAAHSLFAKVKNQDLTANFKRKAYYTYKNFIQASPVWNKFAPLPDVLLPASAPVSITNADFEQGQTAWSSNATIDTTVKRSGFASAKLVNDTGMTKRAGHSVLPIEPNKSYFLKAYVRIDPVGSGNMNTMVQVNVRDASGKYLDGGPSNYYIYDTVGAWREIHYPFRTPANGAQLVIYLSTGGGTGTAWFDDISVEPYDLSHKAIMGRR